MRQPLHSQLPYPVRGGAVSLPVLAASAPLLPSSPSLCSPRTPLFAHARRSFCSFRSDLSMPTHLLFSPPLSHTTRRRTHPLPAAFTTTPIADPPHPIHGHYRAVFPFRVSRPRAPVSLFSKTSQKPPVLCAPPPAPSPYLSPPLRGCTRLAAPAPGRQTLLVPTPDPLRRRVLRAIPCRFRFRPRFPPRPSHVHSSLVGNTTVYAPLRPRAFLSGPARSTRARHPHRIVCLPLSVFRPTLFIAPLPTRPVISPTPRPRRGVASVPPQPPPR